MNTYTYTCSIFSLTIIAATPSEAANAANVELSRNAIPVRILASDLTLFRHSGVRLFKHTTK